MNLKGALQAAGATLALAIFCSAAGAATLSHVVGPQDNLYFTDWGHPHGSALGTGVAARSVADGANPFDFTGVGTVGVVAGGCVVDNGTQCTGPDGIGAGLFRGLDVYALIGIWSSTGSTITPIGSPFVVGSSNTLPVPGAAAAFLFLAENDGNFNDNTGGQYDVRLTFQPAVIPVPAALPLLLSGLGGLALFAGRRRAGGRLD